MSGPDHDIGSVRPLIAEASLTPPPISVSVGQGGVVWLGDAALDPLEARNLSMLLLRAAFVAGLYAPFREAPRAAGSPLQPERAP